MKREQIAIYIRLSKEDDRSNGESGSILAQRALLERYAQEHFTEYDLTEYCEM